MPIKIDYKMTRRQNKKSNNYQPENFAMVAKGASTLARDPRIQQLILTAAERLANKWMNPRQQQLVVYKGNNNNNKSRNTPIYKAPVALNTVARNRRARIQGVNGGITIKHREYIGELAGSTTFNVNSYQIQPGLPQTFPWLSGIANNFEKYSIKSMKFEFVNISATSERGRVTLAFDADPLDSDPVDKVELFSFNGAKEGSAWAPLVLSVPCKSATHFTRNGLVVGTDLKTYDCGRLIAASSNNSDASVIGELFVSYEVELTIPQPVVCPTALVDCTDAVSKTNMFGDSRTTEGSFPATFSANTVTFTAPGNYTMLITVIGVLPSAIAIGSGTTQTSVALFSGTNSSNDTKTAILYAIRVASAGEYITFTISGTSISSCLVNMTMSNSLITAE